jgi:hypothetical protein
MPDYLMKLQARSNIGKNRLYLTFTGRAEKDELNRLYTEVRFCVADLKPGYDAVSDFSNCSLMHISGIGVFRKIMNFLISTGVGEIVRIINKKSLLYTQVTNLSSRICGYNPVYVSTPEEAEDLLHEVTKRNGIRLNVTGLPLVYTAAEGKGEGEVINLSVSGCAVGAGTITVADKEDLSLRLKFGENGDYGEEFPVAGRVVRKSENMFAVKFIDMDDGQKDKIWKYLLAEMERRYDC